MRNLPAPDFIAEQICKQQLNGRITVVPLQFKHHIGAAVERQKSAIAVEFLAARSCIPASRQAGTDTEQITVTGKSQLQVFGINQDISPGRQHQSG